MRPNPCPRAVRAVPKAVRVSLPILLIAAVYCGGAPAELLGSDSGDAAGILWAVSVPVAGAANVASACLDRGEGSPRRLAFWGMLLKLCMVPFYLLLLVFGIAMSVGLAVVPGLVFAAPLAAGLLAAVGYVLMLFTSSYGFAAAPRARSQGFVDGGTASALAVLHAVPVADAVAAVVLYAMVRRADGGKEHAHNA